MAIFTCTSFLCILMLPRPHLLCWVLLVLRGLCAFGSITRTRCQGRWCRWSPVMLRQAAAPVGPCGSLPGQHPAELPPHIFGDIRLSRVPQPPVCLLSLSLSLRTKQTSEKLIFLCNHCVQMCVQKCPRLSAGGSPYRK